MHHVFLGIGGNSGNKPLNLKRVLGLIENRLGKVKEKSSVYETPPWGFYSEDNFLNQVIEIETERDPLATLEEIHRIEALFDRKRSAGRYVSREMDIDILYFDAMHKTMDDLIIPHPLMQKRLFVLVPLTEIAPDFVHPVLCLTNRQLLKNCSDRSIIRKLDDPILQ